MRLLRWLQGIFHRFAPGMAATFPWVGGFLLLLAAGFAVHSWNFGRQHVKAMATITENVSSFAPKGGVVYYPRFRFRMPNGELMQVVSTRGSEDIDLAAGEVVPVLYRAGDPQHAIIATVWRAYFGAIIFGVLGVAFFDVGFVLRMILRRRLVARRMLT